jgi:hypothetical protein
MKTQIKARRIRTTTPIRTNLRSLESFSLSLMQETVERLSSPVRRQDLAQTDGPPDGHSLFYDFKIPLKGVGRSAYCTDV